MSRDKARASAYQKEWKRNRSPEQRARDTESMNRANARRRAMVNAFKNVPCADCGVRYPPYVMDFDHRPGVEKKGDVAYLSTRAPWAQVVDEIQKCDVVCSNCHRERTFGTRK